jgi:GTP pyrophosphokinase
LISDQGKRPDVSELRRKFKSSRVASPESGAKPATAGDGSATPGGNGHNGADKLPEVANVSPPEPVVVLAPEPAAEENPLAQIGAKSTSNVWGLLGKLKPLQTPDKSGFVTIAPGPEERAALEQFWTHLPNTFDGAQQEQVLRAYMVASYAHRTQNRDSGEPYIIHPIAVAGILTELRMDAQGVAAGLLHDVVEDTDFDLDYIALQFGPVIKKLVDGVTKLKKIKDKGTPDGAPISNQKAESLRKMMMFSIEDLRVLIIKLADRLHNMRTLGVQKEHKRRRTARETLDYYAPIANRLGIWSVKSELEDLSFRYVNPAAYKEIKNALSQKESDREKLVIRIKTEIERALADAGIPSEVSGRGKHIYSIYKKMQRKGVDFNQIYDVHGFRVIVDTIPHCYAALGVVHNLWHPIPGEFDDYIANPKDNMYRSLHTGVRSKRDGRPLEIQIRTREMHESAELGVAAHWAYKEQAQASKQVQEKIAYLRKLITAPLQTEDSEEFAESMKSDVLGDQVLVFSPNADVYELPAGSTPIDFAYAIHTELGHRCRGANVNGKLVPLDYRLKNGDQVAIMPAKRGGPSRDWLNPSLEYAATQRARSKIRAWFKKQAREENVLRGRQALEKELSRLSSTLSFEMIAKLCNYENLEDFLAAIGYGDVNSQHIVAKVLEYERKEQERLAPDDMLSFPTSSVPAIGADGGLRVQGVEGLLTNLGKCCTPVPGDPIIGYVTKGRGVTIHRANCPNIQRTLSKGANRIIDVSWTVQQERSYPVKMQIVAYDRQGLLRDVASLVSDEHVNIADVSVVTGQKENIAVITATLDVRNATQLARLMTKLDRLPNVREVTRKLG